MNLDFLYSLPIIIFKKTPDPQNFEIFQKAPQKWEEVQLKYKSIRFQWVNRKGIEEIVDSEESYSKALKNSNGQGHFFDTDYIFESEVKIDVNIEPLAKHYLLCLRCEYKNSIFFIKCVNCSNSNRNQLVFKQGSYQLKEKW